MLRNKLFLFASLLFAPYFSFAADGTVLVIDKIAPKNGAFVGVVDSSQAVTNVSNFNNNLSSADDTVQKALDTLDNLAVGGGGATVNVSASSVLYSTGGTTISGDTGFQYDSSVSSVTINGASGINGTFTVDLPNVTPGPFAARGSLAFNPSTDPIIETRSYNSVAPNHWWNVYDVNGNNPGALNFAIGNGSSFNVRVASCTSCLPQSAYSLSGNTGRHLILATQGPRIGDAIAQFDSVGNSSFTIPVYLSTITVNRQLIDSSGSAGISGQVFTSNGSGTPPSWQTVSGGSAPTYLSSFTYTFNAEQAKQVSPFSTSGGQISNSTNSLTGSLLLDASTDESAIWSTTLNNYVGGTLYVDVYYTMVSATSGKVDFEASIMCVSSGDSADLDASSFAAAGNNNETVPGTAGYMSKMTITPTNDSCANGDMIIVALNRDADDGTNDTATGDAEVRKIRLYE